VNPADLTVRSVDGVCVVGIVEDVDTASAERLETAIRQRTAPGAALVVDLCSVPFMDSAGVRLMDRLVGRHRRGGAAVVIVAPVGAAPRFSLEMCEFPADLLAGSVPDAVSRLAGGT
jgi:anti-sigma B factor antagonist